ncbi:MAG: trehalose-phosphatase [Beijerinckiaceae bacterium]
MTDIASSSQHFVTPRDPAPVPARNMALFLDLDGTLLEIAATPKAVVVPNDLVADLGAASKALGGALAIVSGRDLAEVDRLLAPLCLPAAGEHGAMIRLPDGKCADVGAKVPDDWLDALFRLQLARPGVMIERKAHSVVAHFRDAPLEEELVHRTAAEIVARDPERFKILRGKMVIEILPRNVSKGHAVRRFMRVVPFRGRKPVFVGDDVTDEHGFEAAVEFGGAGLHVAEYFGGQPQEVRRWLKRLGQS